MAWTAETKKRFSEARKGNNNPFFGKHHSKKCKDALSSMRYGESNPFYGKKHTMETRSKQSRWTHENKTGCNLSNETKRKIGLAHKGKLLSDEHKKRISENSKGHKKPDGHGEKVRQANLNKQTQFNRQSWVRFFRGGDSD